MHITTDWNVKTICETPENKNTNSDFTLTFFWNKKKEMQFHIILDYNYICVQNKTGKATADN